jgi:hypothetical protein
MDTQQRDFAILFINSIERHEQAPLLPRPSTFIIQPVLDNVLQPPQVTRIEVGIIGDPLPPHDGVSVVSIHEDPLTIDLAEISQTRIELGVRVPSGLGIGAVDGAEQTLELDIAARDRRPCRLDPHSSPRPIRLQSVQEDAMLSNEALALFRRHLELRRTVDLDANREAYRELARAGLMVIGSSFAGGQDSVYHVTKEGFERKVELLAATSPLPDSAAAPRC